ncbi:MAG: SAM-dependent chlorinase/fluorinase [Candidatus Eisenbacteria bacterium]|nr:SAM-dependent chlorinase/fluorinase [Candidatus Eisenbacteria bacterium]
MAAHAPSEALLVLVSLPADGSADSLGRRLVEAGLAACIHQLPAGRSTYRWQGAIEGAGESLLVIKTTRAAYAGLEAAISEWHPHEVPEILALPVSHGLGAYLRWLAESVSPPVEEPNSACGLVTLTTDFGTRSGYIGSLRGVILSRDRNLVLIDITHEIAPFDVMDGAIALWAAAPHFPPGTVHLAVVDPGVGGTRRPIIVCAGRHLIVGPDNGLFTPFLDGARVIAIEPNHLTHTEVSPTFHGRDLFAPVAARLAAGEMPDTFGKPIEDPVRLDWPAPGASAEGWSGVILHVDRFGNAISNLPDSLLDGRPHRVSVPGRSDIPLVRTYSEASRGDVVALSGSSGLLEVAIVEGSAAELLGLIPGRPITLHLAG